MIKVLHFADLHVGMENYGRIDPETGISSRIRDFLDRLDEVIAQAEQREADLILFAGDAFKTRDPDPTQQREFATRVKKLASLAPTLLLVGNHDVPGIAARATSVDIFNTLTVDNVIVGRKPDARVVETRNGPVFLAWMPFPVRNRLLAQEDVQGASIEELDRAVEALVADLLAGFAKQAAETELPRVLVGHFSVGGARFGSERSVMIGRDLVIPKAALAEPVWDYVALGHIHQHQNLAAADERPPIVYSGSLERIDFGEEVETKGYCWVELERDATRWSFVPVAARPFRTLHVDARGEEDPTRVVTDRIGTRDLQGAVVRVTIQLDEGQEPTFRRREIEAALTEAGVANIAGISIDVDRTVRAPGVGGSAEALTPLQWLERYFNAKGKPPERQDLLLQAATELLDDPEA